jgi:DNA primase small subunit
VQPTQQHSVSPGMFVPQSKEFVLDVDISDYNDVRLCGCGGSDYCRVCWPIMLCGMKVADHILGDIFGFKHRMFVFSGGRGIHCWVGDAAVRSLSNEARVAVAEFMHLYQGSKEGSKSHGKVDSSTIQHPSFAKNSTIFKICQEYFVQVYVKGMGLLDSSENWDKMLALIDNATVRKTLSSKLEDDWSDVKPEQKWQNISDLLANPKNFALKRIPPFAQSIVYSFIYPRLDVNVSKGLNHLLKAPFCIHPRTGFICVPLSVEQDVDETPFYPHDNCPNVRGLIEDSDEDSIHKMKSRLQMFKEFVGQVTQDQNKQEQNDTMEF